VRGVEDDEQITYNLAVTMQELENSLWLPRHSRCHIATTDLIKPIQSPQNS